MSESEHQELVTGLLLVDGINECYRERSRAPARADQLERLGTQLSAAAARRVRMIHFAFRGAQAAAERERRALELLGIQGGTTWQVEWFAAPVEGLVAIAMGDVVATRRALDQLDALLGHVPTLEPQRDAVRMGYQYLRGEYARVAELAEPFLERHAPRTVIGWGPAYALIVMCLAETGDSERALEICHAALATLSPRDHEYFAMYAPLTIAHAWALALDGQRDQGARLLRATAQRLAHAEEHAAVAVVHNYRARLAHRFGDRDTLRDAIDHMQLAALATDNAALIAQAIRWAHIHAALLRSSAPPPVTRASSIEKRSELDVETLAIATFLGTAHGRRRNRRALELLAQSVCCPVAHLYAFQGSHIERTASFGETEPPAGLDAYVGELLAARASPGTYLLELAANDNAAQPSDAARSSERFHVVVLEIQATLAAVALLDGENTLQHTDQLLKAAELYLAAQ